MIDDGQVPYETWAEIAQSFGVTTQAAHGHYRWIRYSEVTGEVWHEPPLLLGSLGRSRKLHIRVGNRHTDLVGTNRFGQSKGLEYPSNPGRFRPTSVPTASVRSGTLEEGDYGSLRPY